MAGKIQIAQDMLQSGLIRDAREYLTVVNTGHLEPMTESEMSEILLARAENEDLRMGKSVMALMIDDHKFHALEHRAILCNPNSRADVHLVQTTLNHIQQHIDMYTQLEQKNPMLLAMMGEPPLPTAPQGPQQPPPGAPPQNPGGPVQNQMNPTNPLVQQAQAIQKPRMPNLPAGADQGSQQAYAAMQPSIGM